LFAHVTPAFPDGRLSTHPTSGTGIEPGTNGKDAVMSAPNTVPRLSAATLPTLRPDIDLPRYDRAQVQVGIVHFGVGGFHRAHQATYLHRLMQHGEALDYGICGVGLLPGDARMRDVLHAQDGL
jgi:Mannitol dehydrogenase Rossmann domain